MASLEAENYDESRSAAYDLAEQELEKLKKSRKREEVEHKYKEELEQKERLEKEQKIHEKAQQELKH